MVNSVKRSVPIAKSQTKMKVVMIWLSVVSVSPARVRPEELSAVPEAANYRACKLQFEAERGKISSNNSTPNHPLHLRHGVPETRSEPFAGSAIPLQPFLRRSPVEARLCCCFLCPQDTDHNPQERPDGKRQIANWLATGSRMLT